MFLFNRLPKFKYIEEIIIGLMSLETNLQENACKNAKLLNFFFSSTLFFLLSACLNL